MLTIDPRKTKNGGQLSIFVVPKDEAEAPTLADIVEHLKQVGVASYRLPEYIEYTDAIPRNPVGKVLKVQLRQQASVSCVGQRAA